MGSLCLFLDKKNLFLSKKQKPGLKKQVSCFFSKKNKFFLTPIIFQYFFVIFPLSDDLEQVTSLSV